jgi:hypothetical protein
MKTTAEGPTDRRKQRNLRHGSIVNEITEPTEPTLQPRRNNAIMRCVGF